MQVRAATTADLPAIVSIGYRAWKEAFEDLLETTTVDRYLDLSYSLEAICLRLDDHPILVADHADDIAAFADVIIEDDVVTVAEICTNAPWRRRGFASSLVKRAQSLAPRYPLVADVVLGNEIGERFYERIGFVPGETVQIDFFGQQIVQRRWWRHPADAA